MPRPATTPATPTAPTATQLAVIRIAMLAGVLVFGGVVWWTRRSGDPRPADPGLSAVLGVLPLALGAVALVAAVLIRRVLARDPDPARQATLRIVGWAVGEAAALGGAVAYFLTGNATSYMLGLIALMLTFVVLPLRERR